jgi:hypothetical protein
MAHQDTRFFNTEKLFFLALSCLALLFTYRSGLLDPLLGAASLPPAVEPLPSLPGPPMQEGVNLKEGFPEPDAQLAALGRPKLTPVSRNPFAPAFDELRVVAAQLTSTVTLSPAGGTADVTIGYRILPHPVSKFEFLLPPNVRLVRVSGSGVIEHDNPKPTQELGEDGNLYAVRLRSPVDRRYELTLRLSWARPRGRSVLDVPEILMPDTTHERGLIVIQNPTRMHAKIDSAENVTRLTEENLPPGLDPAKLLAAFVYTSHPYAIRLDVSRKIVHVARPKDRPDKPKPKDLPDKPAPGTQVKGPQKTPKQPKQPPVEPGPEWKVPVSFKGTYKVGNRICVLLENAGDVIRKFEGDRVLGMTVVKIYPTSVILENEEGTRFRFKDKLREEHEY